MYDKETRELMKEHDLNTEVFEAMYHAFYGYTKDFGTVATRAVLEKVCKDIEDE